MFENISTLKKLNFEKVIFNLELKLIFNRSIKTFKNEEIQLI